MSFFKLNKLGFMVAGAALLALAVTQGCSSDDDSQATPSGGSAGMAGKSGSGNGEGGSGNNTGEGGSGDTGNTGGVGDSGSGNTDAGAGGEAGGPGGNCTGADGCYSCTPTTSLQFENGCVAGGCPDTFTDKLSKIALVGTL